MAEVAYLKLTDKKSGQWIQGGCQEKATKYYIEVQEFRHKIKVPTHQQTGSATGETTHEPIIIVKPIDRSSPLLQLALNEHHEVEGEIHLYRSRDGKRSHWYTISFSDARITEIETYKPMVLAKDSDLPDLERLEVRYRKISWQHKEQNKEAEADWLDK